MQMYTVKRIPGKKPSDTRWEILGPGAPKEPIASEAIANMIRGHLENAAAVLREHFDTADQELRATTKGFLTWCRSKEGGATPLEVQGWYREFFAVLPKGGGD